MTEDFFPNAKHFKITIRLLVQDDKTKYGDNELKYNQFQCQQSLKISKAALPVQCLTSRNKKGEKTAHLAHISSISEAGLWGKKKHV